MVWCGVGSEGRGGNLSAVSIESHAKVLGKASVLGEEGCGRATATVEPQPNANATSMPTPTLPNAEPNSSFPFAYLSQTLTKTRCLGQALCVLMCSDTIDLPSLD